MKVVDLFKPLFYIFCITVFLIIIGNFVITIFYNPANLYNGDYFINYEGGFVRRGLDGEIIFLISKITGIFPWRITKIYSLSFLLAFFVLTIYQKIKFGIPSLFFLSMSFLIFFQIIALPLRKDHIILTIFLIMITFLDKRKFNDITILIVNIFLIVGTLIHEIFFLVSFFPILIIILVQKNLKYNIFKTILYFFAIPFIVFIFCSFLYPGNAHQKIIIINSWKNFGIQHVKFNYGIFEKPFYIWTYMDEIWKYLYLIMLLLINFAFVFSLVFFVKPPKKQINKFLIILSAQYVIAILLCIVATDFSRWIFVANFTSIILFFRLYDFRKEGNHNNLKFKKYIFVSYFLYFFSTCPFFIRNAENIDAYFQVMPLNIIRKLITIDNFLEKFHVMVIKDSPYYYKNQKQLVKLQLDSN